MDLRFLKKARVIISIIFILTISLLYFDLSFSIQSAFADYPLFLQFIPSFLSFLSAATITASGFIFVIILTLLFGRVYCSTICPLGILQDIITFIRKKIKHVNYYKTEAFTKTRNSILIISVISFLLGSSIALNLLDPFSNFGRILTNLFRPIAVILNNGLTTVLELFNIYAIGPMEFTGVTIFPFLFSLALFFTILWLSYYYGRLYCNSICPVGTLLGLISKVSFFRIGIIESNCIECGDCETVCKSNCIQSESKSIDFSRCVGCFNCFDVCPSIGISYKPRYELTKSQERDPSKRNFFKNVGIFLLGTQVVLKAQEKIIEVYKENTTPVIRNSAVSPPGSISIENFTDHCTACHLCVSSCPTQVLQPSFLEYGILGIMQPRMDYITGYCNYDCTICTDVCPSGAIQTISSESKKLIQLGKAIFIKENCVVYTQKTDCGACAEHCPTKAVRMELDTEVKIKAPIIDEKICVGCGACEYACPTKPYKAIYVEANTVHQIAQKPKEEKIEEVIDLKEEFPF
ncbi:MAG: 4Fe-4S binding protein [Melioribacteraceae bacterium]|nr:4Fe-4S binding protein [Melioribacteraceae bacterium]